MDSQKSIAAIIYELRFTKTDNCYLEEQVLQINASNKLEAKIKIKSIAQKNSGIESTLDQGFQIWKFKGIGYIVPVVEENSITPFITRRIESYESLFFNNENEYHPIDQKALVNN